MTGLHSHIERASQLFLHCCSLALLALPAAGFQFILAVDLPNHLAIVRLWSERLHGIGYYDLPLNFTPVYKIWYLLALAIYEVLPSGSTFFPSAVVIVGIWAIYFVMLLALKFLTKSERLTGLHSVAACYLAMLAYSPAFGWGLMSFWFAIPFAIAAGAAVLRWILDGERRDGIYFLLLASIAQITHPLVILFFAAFLVCAIPPFMFGRLSRQRLRRVSMLSVWPAWAYMLQHLSAGSGGSIDYSKLAERNWNPFHSFADALTRYQGFREALYYRPLDITVPYQMCAVVAGALVVSLLFGWWLLEKLREDGLRGITLGKAEQDALRLFIAGILVIAGYLFFEEELIEVEGGPGSIWYYVRAPSFAVPFFMSLLMGSFLLWSVQRKPGLKLVLAAALLSLSANRAVFLRAHGLEYEQAAKVYYDEALDRDHIHREQRIPFHYNFAHHRCIFRPTCSSYARLWFNVTPEATIYPLSPAEIY